MAAPSPLWTGLCLAGVMALAKAALVELPPNRAWLTQLALFSHQDVAVGVSAGLVASALVHLLRARPTAARRLRFAFLGAGAIASTYSVVGHGVFAYFQRPLTFHLLVLARDVPALRSSIAHRLTPDFLAALVLVPVGFVLLSVAGSRFPRLHGVGVALGAAWISLGALQPAPRGVDIEMRPLMKNPQLELVRTTLLHLARLDVPHFDVRWEPGDVADFRTFAARPGADATHFVPPSGTRAPRSVIVVVLESVGTKYLSLYGSPWETTPNLVREAAHALVFDNFYAHVGYTYNSAMALLFSVHPGVPWSYFGGMDGPETPPVPPTMAQRAREAGSRTVLVHNGSLEWGGLRWVLADRGFDALLDQSDLDCPTLSSWGKEDRCAFDRLLQWIDERPGEPFYALCWTDQTHDPFEPSPGAEKRFGNSDRAVAPLAADLARYLENLWQVDDQLGRVFEALRARGIDRETLVVVTGDHGEAFRDPHPHRGHGFGVYDEDLEVPLMLWNPALFSPGGRVATVAGHVDLNPTVADVLGMRPSPGWQGHSLFDPAHPSRVILVSSAYDYVLGLREGSWKLVYDATSGDQKLFHMEHDPAEQLNRAADEPARVAPMRRQLAAWVAFEQDFLLGRAR